MTSIQDLANEINRQLALYAHTVAEDVDKEAERVAKDGAEKLKAISPKDTGKYAKSWKFKKVKGKWIVYNKDHYRLTHLLEKSYAKASGGRSTPKPHIKPTEVEMVKDFEDGVRRVARQ